MKKMFFVLVVSLCVLGFASVNSIAAPLDDAKALIEKAEAYYKANGREQTIKELNNPKGQFVKGELYVFAWDLTGTSQAHPINPKEIGLNLQNVPDVDGKYFRKEVLDTVTKNGVATVEYKFKNPTTGKTQQKEAYWKKVGELILGCGYYK
jgi:cytochrome c